MLDGVSLDQPRTFSAAADEGSLSAAGAERERSPSPSRFSRRISGAVTSRVFLASLSDDCPNAD
jgi:hypothetical protein